MSVTFLPHPPRAHAHTHTHPRVTRTRASRRAPRRTRASAFHSYQNKKLHIHKIICLNLNQSEHIQTFIFVKRITQNSKRITQKKTPYFKAACTISHENESGTSQKYQKRIKKLSISFPLFSIT